MRKSLVFSLSALVTLSSTGVLFAQDTAKRPEPPSTARKAVPSPPPAATVKPLKPRQTDSSGETVGIPWTGNKGVEETTEHIMIRQAEHGPDYADPEETEEDIVRPDRSHLSKNPDSPNVAQWPPRDPSAPAPAPSNPQTPGVSFTGATLSETSAFPPDTMGAVGPSQFIVAVNNRIKTFNKVTGVADGVLNTSTNLFFNSVRNGSSTSDPRIRYDRLTDRWFILIINVPTPNRVLLAVSNNGTITAGTVWTFFFFQQDQAPPAGDSNCLADYPTLGIDANALYVGVNLFCPSYGGTTAFVIRKSSVLGAGPIVVTAFRNLTGSPGGSGIYTPQGVDNFDPGTTTGYLIGVDNISFGTLVLRKVTNPGGTPVLSANIPITVPQTSLPLTVRHQGNTGGSNGQLDALDDRLIQAVIRNGKLWTAHTIGVDNTGVSDGAARTRNACRWYQFDNLDNATPTLVQSGTLFTASATNTTNDRNYWIPSVMVNGQGHMALGSSIAGTNEFANAATAGRLASDPPGTLQAPIQLTNSATAYNPPGDNGSGRGYRRWGDYSYTSLDPCDDMTMWTIQEFCESANSYSVRVVQLFAPPPATPTSASPSSVPAGQASVNVQVSADQINGSAFYDPGAGFNCHIGATVSGGVVVNSVTYNGTKSITLNISTLSATNGPKDVTVTNPDGQSVTGQGVFSVGGGVPCTYSINPTSQNFVAAGGTGSVSVTTQSGCAWTAVSNAAFITITSGASGTGNGTVGFSVAQNILTSSRSGTMTIAGQTFTVTQDPASTQCVTGISPPSNSFGTTGGIGIISVTTQSSCNWTAVSDSPWIFISTGSSGTGNGKIRYNVAFNSGNNRTGTITIGDFVHTVSQNGPGGGGCTYSINPTSQNFGASGGTGSVGVTTQSGCAWTAVSNTAFITITSGASGSGSGSVNFSVQANSTTSPRSGTMTVAGQTFTVTQDPAAGSCTYSINPTSQNFVAAGGTGSVGVTTQSGCAWTAVSNAAFITITSGASGSGSGSVNFSVQANPNTSSRSGTMTVAGQTFTVTQDPAAQSCTYSINPTSQNFGASGGTGSVGVTTQSGCAWTAVSNTAFITITSGASGSGSGSVNFSVQANSTTSPRSGTMTVAGQTFTVTQDPASGGGCSVTISPSGGSFSATGGKSTITVTAPAGCNWTATSSVNWVLITSGSSGTGNGKIVFFVGFNTSGGSRTGTITVNDKTYTINQL